MGIQVVLIVVAVMGLAAVGWWSWSQRRLAQQQADMQRELLRLSREVSDVAHDLQSLLASISVNATVAKELPAGERAAALDDVERAAWSAARMVTSLRTQTHEASETTCRPLIDLHVGLLERAGVEIDVQTDGDLLHDGDDLAAERVIQNLLGNAVRASLRHPDGFVRVRLTDDRLVITNPIHDDVELGPEIWDRAVGGAGSTGLGLAIVRRSAADIGWTARHEVEGDRVHFIVERRARARISGVSASA